MFVCTNLIQHWTSHASITEEQSRTAVRKKYLMEALVTLWANILSFQSHNRYLQNNKNI